MDIVGCNGVEQLCELVLGFKYLTVISVVDIMANMLTQVLHSLVSFRFGFCMIFRTSRNIKPVKLKPQVLFCDLEGSPPSEERCKDDPFIPIRFTGLELVQGLG